MYLDNHLYLHFQKETMYLHINIYVCIYVYIDIKTIYIHIYIYVGLQIMTPHQEE